MLQACAILLMLAIPPLKANCLMQNAQTDKYNRVQRRRFFVIQTFAVGHRLVPVSVSHAHDQLPTGPIRFTVASKTVEGDSAESKPSVAVRPNEPLPEGWKENFNTITGKVCALCCVFLFRFHTPRIITCCRAYTAVICCLDRSVKRSGDQKNEPEEKRYFRLLFSRRRTASPGYKKSNRPCGGISQPPHATHLHFKRLREEGGTQALLSSGMTVCNHAAYLDRSRH